MAGEGTLFLIRGVYAFTSRSKYDKISLFFYIKKVKS